MWYVLWMDDLVSGRGIDVAVVTVCAGWAGTRNLGRNQE